MTIALQFLGAARHVTGSKHLLIVNDRKVLLDCGMVQGPRKIANQANRNLPIGAGDVDAVVLSHAHIDHSGSLPKLVRDGYDGPIWCTEATADLLRIMLHDSASIQESDARYLRKRGHDVEPTYTAVDVDKTLRLLRTRPYYKAAEVLPEVRVEFIDAGHILGAGIVVLDVDDGKLQRKVVFTGDHGRKELPILRDPDRIPECDVLITESTYGDRKHDQRTDMEDSLAKIVEEEMQDGGRILIPAFSVGRTQNVVLMLGQLMESGRIRRLPLFIDSPLSREATKVMASHPEVFDDETRAILKRGQHPFFFRGVRYVSDVEESKSLNSVREGVIVSASGMVEAGRILHHLKRSVERPEDCVLMVGYQARGTLGRKLLEGAEEVRILGKEYSVQCKVRAMAGLSAHADYRELLGFERHLADSCRQVFVVHGEEGPAMTYADRLREVGFSNIEVPEQGQKFAVA